MEQLGGFLKTAANQALKKMLKSLILWLISLIGPIGVLLLVVVLIVVGYFGSISSGNYTNSKTTSTQLNEAYVEPYKQWADRVNPPVLSTYKTESAFMLPWGVIYAVDISAHDKKLDNSVVEQDARAIALSLAPVFRYEDRVITEESTDENGHKKVSHTTIKLLTHAETFDGTYDFVYQNNSTQIASVNRTQNYEKLDLVMKKYANKTNIQSVDRTWILELAVGVQQKHENLEWTLGKKVLVPGKVEAYKGEIPKSMNDAFHKAGEHYGIPWYVLKAIAQVESTFNPNAIGPVCSDGQRAQGLMQFKPTTWSWMGVDGDGDGIANPFDPNDAIFSAAHYLNYLVGTTGNLPTAIKDYGEGTDEYLNKVLSLANQFLKEGN